MSETIRPTESEHITIEQYIQTFYQLDHKVHALRWSKRGIGRGGQNYARFAKSVTQQFEYFNRYYTSVVLDVGIKPVYITYVLKYAKKRLDLLTSFQSNIMGSVAGICPVNASAEPIMVAQTTLTKTIAIIDALIKTHITEFKQMCITNNTLLGTYMREYLAQTFPQLV
jgi:hypothetical protein